MNLIIARALVEDARQQVLDNKIFRLLVILTGVPILFTFLVGFHPDEIRLLWGWKTIDYEPLFRAMGRSLANTPHPDEDFIQTLQDLVVNFFGGSLGMMFCIAATAFFTPRILEKGTADTLFSKPVSRLVILLSRYFAGVLFIALLASVLVLGMFLGLWVTSGYNDPGFLWGVLTLIYLFSLIHAFSMCVAALTRSSTAAILLSLILFLFSGAIHNGWMFKEWAGQARQVQAMRASGEAEDGEQEEKEEQPAILKTLVVTLDTFHYLLPKTSDADIITNKLRRALTEAAPQLATADGELLVKRAPEGFSLVEESVESLEGEGVRWIADGDGEIPDGVVSLRRYPRPEVEDPRRNRTRQKTARNLAKELAEELAAREGLDWPPETENAQISGVSAQRVGWGEAGRARERFLFQFGNWMYEIDFDLPVDESDGTQRNWWQSRFLQGRVNNLVLGQVAGLQPDEWYEKTFSWTAPWKFNVFFSIGSSLAFALAMLFIAWAKLRRIDF